jgi:hypothetical protein
MGEAMGNAWRQPTRNKQADTLRIAVVERNFVAGARTRGTGESGAAKHLAHTRPTPCC